MIHLYWSGESTEYRHSGLFERAFEAGLWRKNSVQKNKFC
jgi:hypothetical protein